MKHSFFAYVLLVILSAFVIISCSKKDEPEPSMGDQAAGTYTLTKLALSSGLTADVPFTNPVNGITLSGKVEVKKIADDKVSAIVTQSDKEQNGKITETKFDIGEVILKKAASGEIEAFVGTAKIGGYANSLLTVNFVHPSLGPITLIGKKN
ncbi:hypothetical protein [Runella slithyformis]|uniref:Lipocalin-like domain-containing protein n=1 Tax=Runella slithyformis (strain ATCC 29530 / DSM 19594 / LMG 11500 / NCIMB 11436 / LSU 4) TaxID=761193 RepID=A0A7U3ZNU6_RUNSL|nr:hypothetical protein [Runella slithyformis]AEI50646.1 hypothetical protein Runsl_4308 [Runella slithyformis DSM 19594]